MQASLFHRKKQVSRKYFIFCAKKNFLAGKTSSKEKKITLGRKKHRLGAEWDHSSKKEALVSKEDAAATLKLRPAG